MAPALAMPRRRSSALPIERSVLPNGLQGGDAPTCHPPDRWRWACSWASARATRTRRRPASRTSSSTSSSRARGGYPEPGALSEAIEGCGGAVNASTDRELTVYSAKRAGGGRADAAWRWWRSWCCARCCASATWSAEKPVIVDEIRMYVDSPGTTSSPSSTRLLFGDHSLGREIAGTPRSVRRATHEGVVGHWGRWYRPAHLVLAAAGAITHDAVRGTAAGLVRAADALARRRAPERAAADRCGAVARAGRDACGSPIAGWPRATCAWACPAWRATIRTAGRWTCWARCWATA